LKRRYVVGSVLAVLLVALFAWAAFATDSEMYFSSDSNGANRVTNIQEGDEIWIVVYDPDQNIDCDVRDKMSPDIKIMDPKTGAYIIWDRKVDFDPDSIGDEDYLEETGADTNVFVSHRAFKVGTREDFTVSDYTKYTHVVDNGVHDFQWGHYIYDTISSGTYGDVRGYIKYSSGWTFTDEDATNPPQGTTGTFALPHASCPGADARLIGRFENMDTLVGMYEDPNDPKDIAVTMAKIIDTEATISWDQESYKDANGSAKITIVDHDENVNCNEAECVPVFIIVNPGSWNVQTSPNIIPVNNFCMLKRLGGWDGYTSPSESGQIRWYNIYDDRYINYPTSIITNVVSFDIDITKWGVYSKVVFYACETGVNTGVFELPINSILKDLGFNSLDVYDVLVAYYLDPNDFDDFKLATAYIEERVHSITSFTDANRTPMSEYWIGRDPVYIEVIDSNANVDPCCPEQVVVHICDVHCEDDSEWLILDETSQNSPIFFTNAGTLLLPVWDALGIGLAGSNGGYQLQLDNWKLEAFNEDSVYARYNDVYYASGTTGMAGLGDVRSTDTADTAFPPEIREIRVDNDVSFDLMEIGDTQVYDGSQVKMYFLDRQGNRVSGYVNSDCVFVEVIDIDQNEDMYRRERIDGFWDGPADLDGVGGNDFAGQNIPFGPTDFAANHATCVFSDDQTHSFNALLGDTNIFASTLQGAGSAPSYDSWAKLYVLNPRNGRWASVDLLEDGVTSGDFVSVTCIDLVTQYECLPMLGVLPGDTIVAVYQDPSNHSDSAWISIKVGIGGGGVPPGQASSTDFVDAEGNTVTTYTDADDAYVKVIDPSHAGADTLTGLEVEGTAYDLSYLEGANTDTFITEAISLVDLGAVAGDEITANYTDATDSLDTSTDTVPIISSELVFEGFIAKPNPFSDEVTFTFEGAGIPETFAVTVYNMSGHLVWSEELANATEIVWDGQNEAGMPLANGPYIYVAMITDGTDTYTGKGKVFINK